MPNWCRNELIITDFASELPFDLMLMKLVDFVQESMATYEERLGRVLGGNPDKVLKPQHLQWHARSVFDFENIKPYPEEFVQQDKDYEKLTKEEFAAKYPDDKDGTGGYRWRLKNWGTKWNASDSLYVPQQKTFYFETAWGPAEPVISELHKLFPEAWMSYEYYEHGAGFMGGCEFVPEKFWDPADYTIEEVNSIEQSMKRGEMPTPSKWEAGKAYNPWTMQYLGCKGG